MVSIRPRPNVKLDIGNGNTINIDDEIVSLIDQVTHSRTDLIILIDSSSSIMVRLVEKPETSFIDFPVDAVDFVTRRSIRMFGALPFMQIAYSGVITFELANNPAADLQLAIHGIKPFVEIRPSCSKQVLGVISKRYVPLAFQIADVDWFISRERMEHLRSIKQTLDHD
jgi:hypothetical protein